MRGGTRAWASFLTWPFPPGKLRRLPTRGPRPHGRRGRQETSRLIPSARSDTKAGGGGGRTTISALREEKVSEEPAERRRSAKLGETAETLRGEEARGSGFPLNCARHSGKCRAPDCAFPSALGISAAPRGFSERQPGPAVPTMVGHYPSVGSLAASLLTASGRGWRPRRR